jgi:hypothetical protein
MDILSTIYFQSLLKEKIFIPPQCLKSKKKIKESIELLLREKIEGKCIHDGYVMPNTIEMVKYEKLEVVKNILSIGALKTTVHFTANICNPSVGNIIECNVKNVKFVHKLGLLGYMGPITIIVGREFHEGEILEELLNVKVNDVIRVEIIAKQFSLNNTEIKVIARLWSDKYKSFIKKEFISSKLTLEEDEEDWNTETQSSLGNANLSTENMEWEGGEEGEEEEEEEEEEIPNSSMIKKMNKTVDDIELEEDENSELDEEDTIPDSDMEEQEDIPKENNEEEDIEDDDEIDFEEE